MALSVNMSVALYAFIWINSFVHLATATRGLVSKDNINNYNVSEGDNITLYWKLLGDWNSSFNSGSYSELRFSVKKENGPKIEIASFDLLTLRIKHPSNNNRTGNFVVEKVSTKEYGITISNVAPEDEGQYSCDYFSPDFNMTGSGITVKVKVKPKKPTIKADDSDTTLTCDPAQEYIPTDKRLPLTVTWYKDGQRVDHMHGQLTIGPGTHGVYECSIQENGSAISSDRSQPYSIEKTDVHTQSTGVQPSGEWIAITQLSETTESLGSAWDTFTSDRRMVYLTCAAIGVVVLGVVIIVPLLCRRNRQVSPKQFKHLTSIVTHAGTNASTTLQAIRPRDVQLYSPEVGIANGRGASGGYRSGLSLNLYESIHLEEMSTFMPFKHDPGDAVKRTSLMPVTRINRGMPHDQINVPLENEDHEVVQKSPKFRFMKMPGKRDQRRVNPAATSQHGHQSRIYGNVSTATSTNGFDANIFCIDSDNAQEKPKVLPNYIPVRDEITSRDDQHVRCSYEETYVDDMRDNSSISNHVTYEDMVLDNANYEDSFEGHDGTQQSVLAAQRKPHSFRKPANTEASIHTPGCVYNSEDLIVDNMNYEDAVETTFTMQQTNNPLDDPHQENAKQTSAHSPEYVYSSEDLIVDNMNYEDAQESCNALCAPFKVPVQSASNHLGDRHQENTKQRSAILPEPVYICEDLIIDNMNYEDAGESCNALDTAFKVQRTTNSLRDRHRENAKQKSRQLYNSCGHLVIDNLNYEETSDAHQTAFATMASSRHDYDSVHSVNFTVSDFISPPSLSHQSDEPREYESAVVVGAHGTSSKGDKASTNKNDDEYVRVSDVFGDHDRSIPVQQNQTDCIEQ